MVSSRNRDLFRRTSSRNEQQNGQFDVENGNPAPPKPHPRVRFRDAVESTMSQQHARELKQQLLENVDHNALEKFRKSDEEVRFTRMLCGFMF